MQLTNTRKQILKNEIISSLRPEKEIYKIVIFGSFLYSDNPNDIDIAVFQNSNKSYLDLAMKYRKLTRAVSKEIPVDIFPIKEEPSRTSFLTEIESGELIYEK